MIFDLASRLFLDFLALGNVQFSFSAKLYVLDLLHINLPSTEKMIFYTES